MAARESQSAKSANTKEFDFLLSPVRSCQSENGKIRTGWTQELCRNFVNSARPVFSGLLERIMDKSYEVEVTAELRKLLVQLNSDFEEKIGGVFATELQRAVGLRDQVISDLEKQLHKADKSVLNRVEVVESHYTPLLKEKRKEIEFERNRANALDTKLRESEGKVDEGHRALASAEQQIALLQKECLSKGEKVSALKAQVKRHCVAIETLRADRKSDAEHYLKKITYLSSELESVTFPNTISSEEKNITPTPRNFNYAIPPDNTLSEEQPAVKELRCIVCESQIARELSSLSSLIVTKFTKVEQESNRLDELVRSTKSLISHLKSTRVNPELSRYSSPTRMLHWVSGTIGCLALGAMLHVCMQLWSDRYNRYELS